MKSQKIIRTYEELISLPTFEERFDYLKIISGRIGEETFGFDRYFNQKFYRSAEWRRVRNQVILRDCGCDLGIRDREIRGRIIIHHMNPISMEDLLYRFGDVINPDFLICTSKLTHDAIHYGDKSLLQENFKERKPFDTCPWRQ